MNYLQLVNHVIRESGNELNELTDVTWDTAAGQRMYPRLKNYVRQAWKMIQMERDQWEFNNAEVFTEVRPRFKFKDGFGSDYPQGQQFRGVDSGMLIEVLSLPWQRDETEDWVASGISFGQVEFRYIEGSTRIDTNEVFEEVGGDGVFTYLERGSYDFGLEQQDLSEIRWDTLVSNTAGTTVRPVTYIPWENWFYQAYSYNVSTSTGPAWASQDFEGNVVFYPQSLDPFNIHFVYTATPQELENYDDVPARIPSQYHEWIAWEALLLLATYDKNTLLAAHAQRNATPYRRRAEKNLMPLVSWRGSQYNE
jgi:hypothetical protein